MISRPNGTPGRRGLRRIMASAALLLFLPACRFGAPRPGTEQGDSILDLYRLMFYAAIGVAAVVYGLILWSVIRYRRRKGDDDELPEQTRFHIPLEITYTVIPILIVIWLFVMTYRTETPIDAVSPNPDVVVNVTGFQWQWRFEYPDYDITITGTPTQNPTMVLPVGETVRLVLHSPDVIHSFFVPEFLFKRDAIPGQGNEFDIVIPRAGVYRGECAEFCGLNHADMNFLIRAVSPEDFQDWAAAHQGQDG